MALVGVLVGVALPTSIALMLRIAVHGDVSTADGFALRSGDADGDSMGMLAQRPAPTYLRWKLHCLPTLPPPGPDAQFALPWYEMLERGGLRIKEGMAADLGCSYPMALRQSDVVLFCDSHSCRGFRRAFCDFLLAATTQQERESGRVAALFEALPGATASEVDSACSPWGPAESLRATLLRSWSWPVEEYLTAVPALCAAGVHVGGVAPPEFPSGPPLPDAPDHLRTARSSPLPGACEAEWKATNGRVVAAVAGWLGDPRTSQRRCFILVGGGHAAGGDGFLQEMLTHRGYSVVVVTSLDRYWEFPLLDHYGEDYFWHWYEVLPGILRGPVTDLDVVVCGEEERRGRPAPFRFLEMRQAGRSEPSGR